MAKDPKDIRAAKEEANELARKGKFEAAIEVLKKLTTWDKREVQHHIKIAELYSKLKKTPETIQWYESAARKYAEQGYLPKAIAMAKIILGLDPNHKATQEMLSQFYANSKAGPVYGGAPRHAAPAVPAPAPAAAKPAAPPPPAAAPKPPVVETPKPAPVPAATPTPATEPEIDAELDVDIDVDGRSPEEIIAELPRYPLFSELAPAEFQKLIEYLDVRSFQPLEYVITEGEPGDAFFIITQGRATVSKEDYAGLAVELAELGEGAFFGEFGYLADMERTASVIAKTDLEVLQISRPAMDKLVAEHPRVKEVLQQFFKDRVLNTLLTISSLFEPFNEEQKRDVIANFSPIEVAAKTVVIQEGDEAQGLFVIMSGEVEVVRATEDGGIEHLSDLHAGEFFGEMALLTGQATSATVRTTRKSSLFKLPVESFRMVASAHPELVGVMAAFAAERRQYNEAMRKLATQRGEKGLV